MCTVCINTSLFHIRCASMQAATQTPQAHTWNDGSSTYLSRSPCLPSQISFTVLTHDAWTLLPLWRLSKSRLHNQLLHHRHATDRRAHDWGFGRRINWQYENLQWSFATATHLCRNTVTTNCPLLVTPPPLPRHAPSFCSPFRLKSPNRLHFWIVTLARYFNPGRTAEWWSSIYVFFPFSPQQ